MCYCTISYKNKNVAHCSTATFQSAIAKADYLQKLVRHRFYLRVDHDRKSLRSCLSNITSARIDVEMHLTVDNSTEELEYPSPHTPPLPAKALLRCAEIATDDPKMSRAVNSLRHFMIPLPATTSMTFRLAKKLTSFPSTDSHQRSRRPIRPLHQCAFLEEVILSSWALLNRLPIASLNRLSCAVKNPFNIHSISCSPSPDPLP